MWFYLAWIPAAIIFYTIAAICTKFANDNPDSWKWVFVLYFIQAIGIWPIMAKFSKNIVFDSFLFDFIIFTTYFTILFSMGAGSKFTPTQWAGAGIIILGFILLKL
jgi:hypothetical protein